VEIHARIRIGDAKRVGLKVACSPEQDEYTEVSYLPDEGVLEIDFSKSDLLGRTSYARYHNRAIQRKIIKENPPVSTQRIPFQLQVGEELDLHLFIDGCIVEVIANNRTFAVQTIYPSRRDSIHAHLFSRGGESEVRSLETFKMNSTMNL